MSCLRFLLPLLGLLTGAALAAPSSGERAAVQAEIRRVEAAAKAEEVACGTQFVVTSCVDESRRRKREAVAPLRAKLLALDDVERRQRAQARVKAVEDKQRELGQRPEAPAASDAASAARRAAPAANPHPPRSTPTPAQREQAAGSEAAARAAASSRRRQDIEHDAERIRQRSEARAQKGKKSAPLPVPGASAPR